MDFYPLVLRALAIAICLSGLTGPAHGQQAAAKTKTKPANPPELKRLDAKVEEVRESFLRDTTKLIRSFEDVGQFERAKVLLEALQKLDPKNEPVKNKLAELNKQILDTSEFEIDIDPGESWQPVGMITSRSTSESGAALPWACDPKRITRSAWNSFPIRRQTSRIASMETIWTFSRARPG